MAPLSLLFGGMLIVVGLVGFVGTGSEHPTALIPAGIGGVLVVLGLIALKPSLRMHAMHGAALVGLLSFLATARGLLGLATLVSGGTVERPAAVYSQSATAVLSLVFVGLCVNSFLAARRARKARENPPA